MTYFSSHTTNFKGDATDYRFGFNSYEKDNVIKGIGNSLDFGARIYDSRLGRFLSLDPLMNKYPDISPYSFAINSPITFIDINGEAAGVYVNHKTKTIIIKANFYVAKGNVKDKARATAAVNEWNDANTSRAGKFQYEYAKGKPAYKIAFELKVIESEDVQKSVAEDKIGNSFQVDDDQVNRRQEYSLGSDNKEYYVGAYTTKDGKNVYTRTAGTKEDDAHEIGHTLGLGHFSFGIMSIVNDISRILSWYPTIGNVSKILNKANNVLANPGKNTNDKQLPKYQGSTKVIDLGSEGEAPSEFFRGGNVVPVNPENYKEFAHPDLFQTDK